MAESAPARLLVVDDDSSARRMMRRALERRGYAVLDADNGARGVELAYAERPDAILLDMRMPGELSGADVARTLRADLAFASTPIVIVSASAHTDARDLIATLDCEDFIEKPVDLEELYTTLERLLAR